MAFQGRRPSATPGSDGRWKAIVQKRRPWRASYMGFQAILLGLQIAR